MSELEGFWSYVHNDDDAEGGRITQLAHDVSSQLPGAIPLLSPLCLTIPY